MSAGHGIDEGYHMVRTPKLWRDPTQLNHSGSTSITHLQPFQTRAIAYFNRKLAGYVVLAEIPEQNREQIRQLDEFPCSRLSPRLERTNVRHV